MDAKYFYMNNLVAEIPETPADSIISRTVYADDEVKTILFGFAAGQELSEHTAATAAILYFVSGQASLMLGSDSKSAQPGTYVHMEPHLPHSIKAETNTIMLLLLLRSGKTQ